MFLSANMPQNRLLSTVNTCNSYEIISFHHSLIPPHLYHLFLYNLRVHNEIGNTVNVVKNILTYLSTPDWFNKKRRYKFKFRYLIECEKSNTNYKLINQFEEKEVIRVLNQWVGTRAEFHFFSPLSFPPYLQRVLEDDH